MYRSLATALFTQVNDHSFVTLSHDHFKNLSLLLEIIFKKKILKNDGIVILHRHKNHQENFTQKFTVLEEKKYGISKIIFISNLV